MWLWILLGGAAIAAGIAVARRIRNRARPDADLAEFVARFTVAIAEAGPEYGIRGIVPGTLTMILSVHGQEVPVPFENVFHHFLSHPDRLPALIRQLLEEIEEVGLEQPGDRPFADAAVQILPQICSREWLFDRAPAFGAAALVHRDLGPDLVLCYVIDDPWSVVFVCNAHLGHWGRSEADLFHLATRNLRRQTEAELPLPQGENGPVRVRCGDGYDAARVLLLNPSDAEDLLIALPQRDTLWLGRSADREDLETLLAREDESIGGHPVSSRLYRFENRELVPVSGSDL